VRTITLPVLNADWPRSKLYGVYIASHSKANKADYYRKLAAAGGEINVVMPCGESMAFVDGMSLDGHLSMDIKCSCWQGLRGRHYFLKWGRK